MNQNQNQIEELKKLIAESRSFNETEKRQLLNKLPSLTSEEINKVIAVFKKEQSEWKNLEEQDQKDVELFLNFSEQSKKNLTKSYKKMAQEVEKTENEKDASTAEELLKSI